MLMSNGYEIIYAFVIMNYYAFIHLVKIPTGEVLLIFNFSAFCERVKYG